MSGQNPSQIVQDYLAAMEARDLEKAATYLAGGFVMIFPGGVEFSKPAELVEWARDRYRSIGKRYERFDETVGEGGRAVYCYGTLYGEWPDGNAFEGIRFIDRFTVADGKLVDQRVWNDLAEMKP